ncbi:hypothetical protein K501DRAFT_307970 [Backusella circina FSU 941]|nr:hypothetical protein K501DRAFT_307970 [Backusella circina FSU 941]
MYIVCWEKSQSATNYYKGCLLLSKKFQVYKSTRSEKMTGVHDIIHSILAEQNLDPAGYFLFSSQYDLQFAGVVTGSRMKKKVEDIEPENIDALSESDASINISTHKNVASLPEASSSTPCDDDNNDAKEQENSKKEIERLVKDIKYHEEELKDQRLAVETLEAEKRNT